MGAAWVAGYESEHGDEEDGGKGGGVKSQADKTENKTGGKYFPEMVFLSGISLPTFSAAPSVVSQPALYNEKPRFENSSRRDEGAML